MPCLAITGLPGTGKTTFASVFSFPIIHTDEFRNLPWEQQPRAVLEAIEDLYADGHDMIVVEGVIVARILSRGFVPDLLFYFDGPGRGVNSMPWIRSKVDTFARDNPGRTMFIHRK
jgi:adenylate kinase family enzyme